MDISTSITSNLPSVAPVKRDAHQQKDWWNNKSPNEIDWFRLARENDNVLSNRERVDNLMLSRLGNVLSSVDSTYYRDRLEAVKRILESRGINPQSHTEQLGQHVSTYV
ncbi:hypothetical protein CS022_02110 [Veronia nyctiphanis]|uniref:Uncharacterized protein n=1 Tax=Veronia nyctiphanis TaxID=1278244 RepID=A0A4Q0YW08_9GAMM|nr:hypothetical protein [Veronia nyctiphanis]RXJ74424.1 hypothetical protein CS022_02110 [Veronia nyctiphanis]